MPTIATAPTYPAIPVFWSGEHANAKKPLWTDEDVALIFRQTIKRNDPITPFVGDHTANDLPIIGLADGTQYKLLRNNAKNRTEIWATPTAFSDEALQAYKNAGFNRPSLKLRSDLSIKNIALVQNPAVRDIPEITFSADPSDTGETKIITPESDYDAGKLIEAKTDSYYTFGDYRVPKIGRVLNNLRDYFIENIGRERADAIIPREDLATLDSYEPDVPDWVINDISRLYDKIWNLESQHESQHESQQNDKSTPSIIFSEHPMNKPTVPQSVPNAAPQGAASGTPPATTPIPTATHEHVFSADDMQRALREQESKYAAENAAQAARLQALERKAREQDVELVFSRDDFRDRITPALRPIAKRLLINDYDQNGEFVFSADNGTTTTFTREADIISILVQLPCLNTRESANHGVHQFSADDAAEIEKLAKKSSGRA